MDTNVSNAKYKKHIFGDGSKLENINPSYGFVQGSLLSNIKPKCTAIDYLKANPWICQYYSLVVCKNIINDDFFLNFKHSIYENHKKEILIEKIINEVKKYNDLLTAETKPERINIFNLKIKNLENHILFLKNSISSYWNLINILSDQINSDNAPVTLLGINKVLYFMVLKFLSAASFSEMILYTTKLLKIKLVTRKTAEAKSKALRQAQTNNNNITNIILPVSLPSNTFQIQTPKSIQYSLTITDKEICLKDAHCIVLKLAINSVNSIRTQDCKLVGQMNQLSYCGPLMFACTSAVAKNYTTLAAVSQ